MRTRSSCGSSTNSTSTRCCSWAGATPAAAAEGAKVVLQIETSLAEKALDRVAQRNPTNIYHKMSRDEVKKLMPSFNLSQYFERAEAPPETAPTSPSPTS